MKLTETQQKVVDRFNDDIKLNKDTRNVVVLKGYAGTGKTTVASQIINEIPETVKIIIVAPTTTALANIKDRVNNRKNLEFKTFASISKKYVNCVNILNTKYFIENKLDNSTLEKNQHTQSSDKTLQDLLKLLNAYKININDISSSFYKYDKLSNSKVKQYKIIESKLKEKLIKADNKIFNNKNIFVSDEFIFDEGVLHHKLLNDDNSKAVIIFEEISMIDKSDMDSLLNAIYEYGTPFQKFIFLGDGSQLPPVNGLKNHFVTSANDEKDIFELTEILRSDKEDINVLAGKIRKGVDLTMLYGDIIKYANVQSIDEVYDQFEDDMVESNCIITYMNKNVNAINNRVRKDKFNTEEFIVPKDEIMITENVGNTFYNGEMFTVEEVYELDFVENEFMNADTQQRVANILNSENHKNVPIYDRSKSAYTFEDYTNDCEILISGMKLGLCKMCKIVSKMGKKYNMLIPFNIDKNRKITHSKANDDSLLVEISNAAENLSTILNKVYIMDKKATNNYLSIGMGNFTRIIKCCYAYAMTVHKAQGSEWKNVVVVLSTSDLYILRKNNSIRELVYTAITRAKEKLRVIIY